MKKSTLRLLEWLAILAIIMIIAFSCQQSTMFKMDVPKNLKTPCVIYFSSEGCGWCRKFDPNWETVKKDTTFQSITFYKDSELPNERDLVSLYEISGVPAVVFISSDGVAEKSVGYETESQFRSKMEDFKKLNKNKSDIALKRAVQHISK